MLKVRKKCKFKDAFFNEILELLPATLHEVCEKLKRKYPEIFHKRLCIEAVQFLQKCIQYDIVI